MSFSNAAADLATRAGAVQTQAPKTTKQTRESESARQQTYFNEEGEDTSLFHGNAAETVATEKKVAKRDVRRRRASGAERKRQDESREVTGKRRTDESEKTKKTKSAKTEQAEKAAQTEQTEKTARTGALRRRREDWTPSLGYRTAQDALNQQARLQQASIQFEQVRGNQPAALSDFGKQQAMLDSLINMTEMLYHQHTGDKAGEIYNRPATRQILTALKGLKDGVQPSADTGETTVRKMKKREFKAKMERIEKTHVALTPAILPSDYEPLDLVA